MASNILFSSILVQLFWTALSLAAPVGDEKLAATDVGNTWTYASSGGVIGFIVLILDIIVFIEVLKSNRSPMSKLLWCLLVFLLPVIGMIIYWLFANRAAHRGYEPVP